MINRVGSKVFIGLLALLGACATGTYQQIGTDVDIRTQADKPLRVDLMATISTQETAKGRTGGTALVGVSPLGSTMGRSGQFIHERWVVETAGVRTAYKITMIVAPGGGTDFAVRSIGKNEE